MKTRALFAVGIITFGALGGCDQQAARQARASSALDEAIGQVSLAVQGYVPEGASAEDVAAYRRVHLDEALAQLEALAAQAQGLREVSANRLIGSIRLSHAQADADAAADAFTRVGALASSLLHYLTSLEQLNALIVQRTFDGSAIQGDIQEADQLIARSASQIEARRADLQQERQDAVGRAEAQRGEAQQLLAAADQTEADVDEAHSPQARQRVYERAYSQRRQAQFSSRQAQLAQIEADRLEQRLAALDTEMQLWEQMAQGLSGLRQRVQREGDAAGVDVAAARESRAAAMDVFAEKYQALVQRYRNEVVGRLTAAANHAAASIEAYRAAAGTAEASRRGALEIELTAARVELARVLAMHADYNASFAQTIRNLAQMPALRDAEDRIDASAADTLVQAHDQLTERATAVIDETQENLGAADSDTADAAQVMTAALQSYRERLN